MQQKYVQAASSFSPHYPQPHQNIYMRAVELYAAGTPELALPLFFQSAEQLGNPAAYMYLGLMHARGKGVALNTEASMNFYALAAMGFAEAGSRPTNPNLQYDLSLYHHAANNEGQARACLHIAASHEHAEAQYRLGIHYLSKQDHSAAENFLGRAAKQNHIGALHQLGLHYFRQKQYASALECLITPAQLKFPDAQMIFAYCFFYGLGVPPDQQMAVRWYMDGANCQNPKAQYALGLCFMRGTGIQQNLFQTVHLFQKAASLEEPNAQNYLGMFHFEGLLVKQSIGDALMWFHKAAANGHPQAQRNLGLCYLMGRGLTKDLNTAATYLQKAAAKGDFIAKQLLQNYPSQSWNNEKIYNAMLNWIKQTRGLGNIELENFIKFSSFHPRLESKGFHTPQHYSSFNLLPKQEAKPFRFTHLIVGDEVSKGQLTIPSQQAAPNYGTRIDLAILFGEASTSTSSSHSIDTPKQISNPTYSLSPISLASANPQSNQANRAQSYKFATLAFYRILQAETAKVLNFRLSTSKNSKLMHQQPTQIQIFKPQLETSSEQKLTPKESKLADSQENEFAQNAFDQGVHFFGSNQTDAWFYFTQAANMNYAPAHMFLAYMCEKGLGVNQNPALADSYYVRAVLLFLHYPDQNKQAHIQYDMARFNLAANKDDAAVACLEFSAIQGHIEAQCLLGAYYISLQKHGQALQCLENATAQEHTEAQYLSGICYLQLLQPTLAIQHFKNAALKDHAEAAYQMSLCCIDDATVNNVHGPARLWLKKAAQLGCIDAQYIFGKQYLAVGEFRSALHWLQKAAQQQHPESQFLLGIYYLESQNLTQAMALLEKASLLGHTEAHSLFHGIYYLKLNQYAFAKSYLEKANKQQHRVLYFLLGLCYFQLQQYPKAEQSLQIAAKQGHLGAQHYLDLCHSRSNQSGNAENQRTDDTPHNKSSSESKHSPEEKSTQNIPTSSPSSLPNAKSLKTPVNMTEMMHLYDLGRKHLNGVEEYKKDYIKALECFNAVAEMGNEGALYHAGLCYLLGDHGITQDLEKANLYFQKAIKFFTAEAELGNIDSLFFLGECAYYGHGTPIDYAAAVHWYERAEQLGDLMSHFRLGCCYYYGGYGIAQDDKTAVEWFTKADLHEDEDAQFFLGECYILGRGVTSDISTALQFFKKSAQHGHTEAQFYIDIHTALHAGKFDEAAEHLRDRVTQEDPLALEHLNICRKQQDIAKNRHQSTPKDNKAEHKSHKQPPALAQHFNIQSPNTKAAQQIPINTSNNFFATNAAPTATKKTSGKRKPARNSI